MSEGPISRERAGHSVPRIQPVGTKTVHRYGGPGLGYCAAAHRADEEAS